MLSHITYASGLDTSTVDFEGPKAEVIRYTKKSKMQAGSHALETRFPFWVRVNCG
jgi:hypothetical protein